MTQSRELFLNTKLSKLFWKAAIPGGVAMLAGSLYMIFDTLFIGKLIGTTALAGLGLAMPLVIINFALSELVGVGSSVPISIFLGRHEDERANNYFTSAVLLIFATGLFSGVLIYLSAPSFMRLMGARGEPLEYAVDYIRVYAIFSPVTSLMFAMDNFLRISGKIKTSMILNIVSSVLTVLAELIFIVVFKLEIVGAALGANIAMAATTLFAVGMFVPGKLQLKFVRPHLSATMFLQIYKNGLAPFLTNVSGRIFSVLMNVFLLSYSSPRGEAVAIYGVAMTICSVIEQVLYGTIDSLQPSLGYNYGAKKYSRVKTLERYAMTAGLVISFVGGAFMLIIPAPLSIPFLEDLTLLDATVTAVRITALAYISKWLYVCINCFFMALEKPIFAMIISISDACIIPLTLLFLLGPFELNGLWMNYPVRTMLSSALAVFVLWNIKNKLFPKGENQ